MFFCRQKFNFILHVFLEILQRYCKLVILGTFGMSGYAHPKWYYQLVENFDFFLHAENELHHFFSILRNYILKNLIYWLDDSILAYNSRTWRLSDMGWWWNINNNISFHFKLFPGKTNNNFFSKNPKGSILRFFFPKVGQNSIFLEKRALSDFKHSNYLPSCKKSEKNNDTIPNAWLWTQISENGNRKLANHRNQSRAYHWWGESYIPIHKVLE